ncbi:hypothetical protein JQ544_11535 [Bradyrhizobium diazoefficiens]|nr:hypothetical protein [Bradyrhizobium diazoefficiens]MBR0812159.1 hypothetical protein [Bradyrhizobium diazoefficiens]
MPPTRRIGKAPPYTEWHGNHYRAKLRIPEQLRFHFPIDESGTRFKKFLYANLRTDNPIEAASAAQAFVDRMQRRFRRIARRDRTPPGLLSEARRWRNNIAPEENPIIPGGSPEAGQPVNAEELHALGLEQRYSEYDALVDRAYDLLDNIGHARAMRFFNLASGRTTSLAASVEDWLRSESYSAATCARYRKTVKDLINWCRSNRIPAEIEAINAQRARRFLSRRNNRDQKAIANEKATLSRLWDWFNVHLMSDLMSRTHDFEVWTGDRGDNPWRDVGAQASSNTKRRSGK